MTSIDPVDNGAHIIYGFDVASFGTNITVPRFPFQVWSDTTSENRSALGLGINSSVISSFLEAGVIPSTEMGLFLGSRSVQQPTVGELVIGGYNSAKVNGTFYNFTMERFLDRPCPLQVLLQNVQVSNSEGELTSIIDSGSRIPACINPVENAFQFTQSMFNAWSNATQHPSNPPADGSANFTDQIYPLSNEPLINELIVTLEGGYSVTIPHFELVTPQLGDNAQGLFSVINSSRLEAAVTSNGGRFDFPILGGVFLSQNYLRIDYEQGMFSLAHAATGPVTNESIVSTCAVSSSKSSISKGAIIGAVVSGVAALCLVAAAFFFISRRGQVQRNQSTTSQTSLQPFTMQISQPLTGNQPDVKPWEPPPPAPAYSGYKSGFGESQVSELQAPEKQIYEMPAYRI